MRRSQVRPIHCELCQGHPRGKTGEVGVFQPERVIMHGDH